MRTEQNRTILKKNIDHKRFPNSLTKHTLKHVTNFTVSSLIYDHLFSPMDHLKMHRPDKEDHCLLNVEAMLNLISNNKY